MSKSCITLLIAAALLLPILYKINPAYADIQGPGSSLLAHWRFDEGAGAVAADSSGTGNAGTLVNGAGWTTGRVGSGALRLQRSLSQRVTVNDSPSLSFGNQSFTITAWASLSSDFSNSAIVSKRTGNTGYALATLNSKAIFHVSTSGQEALVHADRFGEIPLNTWVHVAAWYDSVARTINISVNNGPIDTRPYSAGSADTPAPLYIGQFGGSTACWDGSIDDVRVYGRVLSAAERTEIYALLPGTTPPPDTTPPVISNIRVTDAGQSTATISWTTDEPADGQVEFLGPCPTAGCLTALVTPFSTGHTISVSTLAPATTYRYQVRSKDSRNNLALSTVSSFTTLPVSTESFTETIYASLLGATTSMAFAPDGRLFVALKSGQLKVVKNGLVLAAPFVNLPADHFGENGLLGVAFDPNFASNRYVYVYYTNASPKAHRLSRFRASLTNPDIAEAGSEVVIFTGAATIADYHNGGAIHFGLDGKLYLAIGDNSDRPNAQLLSTVNGKILRLNPDGTVPSDNPFVGTPGARGEIWAFGLRNPFTFAFDPASEAMRINDVGGSSYEEVNRGMAGANYGWPTCEGPCNNSAFTAPLYSYGAPANKAITGAAFYRSNQFPEMYQGVYFFGDCINNFINYLDRNNQVVVWRSTTDGPVDIRIGPDGGLYYSGLLTGRVYKISYQSTAANRIPTAVMSASPVSGRAPLAVSFDASASSDPDGDGLSYSWRFGDGTTGSGVSPAKTYTSAGSYLAELTVSDGRGGSATVTQLIAAGNAPVPTITAPAAGTLYTAGNTIVYSGSATDTEDGALPASAFSWTIAFHHANHTHPFVGPINGVRNGGFTIPTLGETAADVWYRVSLTVTDSSGLSQTVHTDVTPRTANVTLNASVAGITLTFDSQSRTLPYVTLSVAGIIRSIGAPSPQTVAGRVYDFVSWSDGGSQDHTISSPSGDTTYTATYRERITQPPSSLLAHWRFDEGAGTVAADSSGTGNPGTLVNGASWTSGAVGASALRLDRALGQRVVVNDSPSLSLGNQDFTIAAWAYVSSDFGTSAIVSKDDGATGYSLQLLDGLAAFRVRNSGQECLVRASSFGPIPLDTWVHVAAWYDSAAKMIQISVDNRPAESRSCSAGTADTPVALTIGQYGSGNYWDGFIDDVRVYSRILSAAELTELKNLGPGGN